MTDDTRQFRQFRPLSRQASSGTPFGALEAARRLRRRTSIRPLLPAQAELVVQAHLDAARRLRCLAEGFAYPGAGHRARMLQQLAAVPRHHQRRSRAAWSAVKRAWRDARQEALEAEYTRLFFGAASLSPRETAYGDGRRIAGRPVELADINGFYQAFALEPSDTSDQLPDHIAVELEFLASLHLKLAYAQMSHQRARGRVVEQAMAVFLEQHLGRWYRAFAGGLVASTLPYATLGRVLVQELDAEVRHAAVHPKLFAGRLPADFMQADALECPRAEVVD
jgi:TorA maturation chaperone TorD